MKKFRKFAALALAGVLSVGLLSACGDGGKEAVTLKVGGTVPHVDILNAAKPLLAEQGITLEVVEFSDYVTPNTSVEDGSLDANYFQHITYMNNFNAENGTHLVSVAGIHYEPMALYGGKTASVAELPEHSRIAVPNDTTNEARALLLLEQEGLITLREGAGINATVLDIESRPAHLEHLEIVEIEAAQITNHLADVDLAVVNGNYAIDAGMKLEDALAIESAEGTAAEAYVNVIAVKEGRENDEAIQALVKALQSDTVKKFIEDTYAGAVVPLF